MNSFFFSFFQPLVTVPSTINDTSNSSNSASNTTTADVTTATSTTTAPTTSTPSGKKTQAELSLLMNTHAPWGSPGFSASETIQGTLKLLLHSSYVIGQYCSSCYVYRVSGTTVRSGQVWQNNIMVQTHWNLPFISPSGLHETMNLGVWVSFTVDNQTIARTEPEKPQLPEGIEIKPEVK